MSKITIDEQIEEARNCLDVSQRRQYAIMATLEFVRDHAEEIKWAVARKKALAEAKADTIVNRILDEFPGAEIEGVGDAD